MTAPKTKDASINVAKYITILKSSKSYIPYDNFISNYLWISDFKHVQTKFEIRILIDESNHLAVSK